MLPKLQPKNGCGKSGCAVLLTDCRGQALCECNPRYPARSRDIKSHPTWERGDVEFRGIRYTIEWDPFGSKKFGPLWLKMLRKKQKLGYIRLMKIIYPYYYRHAVFKGGEENNKDVWSIIPASAVGWRPERWKQIRSTLRWRYQFDEVYKHVGLQNRHCRIIQSELIDIETLKDKCPDIVRKRLASKQWYNGYLQTRRAYDRMEYAMSGVQAHFAGSRYEVFLSRHRSCALWVCVDGNMTDKEEFETNWPRE